MNKRILLITLALIFTVSFAKLEIPQPTSKFFVNDFAGVIDESDEQEIFNMAKSLYESSGNSTQVVAVTINSLNGYSIEEYANELFNKWGIGSKEDDDGVLILLAVNDRESRIEVGYGLEGILTDSGTGKIQDDYMLPYYRNNDFSNGLVSGTRAVCNKINGDVIDGYSINNEGEKVKNTKNQDGKEVTYIMIGALLAIPIYIILYKYRLLITLGVIAILVIGSNLSLLSDFIASIFVGVVFVGIFFCDVLGGHGGSGGGYSGGGGFPGGGGRSGGGGSSRSF